MSDLIQHSKKVLSVALTITTIAWSVGLFALAPVQTQAAAGDLVKAAGSKTVYLVDTDGVTIHPFPHANVYTSWGFPADFSSTFTTDLSGFKVGNDVEFRDGSLVRAKETPAVYIKADGKLLPVVSYSVFQTLGYKDSNITWLPQSFLDKYATGAAVTSTTTHPNGTVIKYANSSKTYLIQGGVKREFASTDVAKVNGYAKFPVITVPATETYADGAKIVVKESALVVPVGVGAAPTVTTPPTNINAGSGVSVSVASDNQTATTILSDSDTSTYPQALIPFLKVNFTAGSDGAVKITSVKFKRAGVASDGDLGNLYLYDGNTKLADYNSFSDKVVTFTNTAGLFTVDAGTTKAITLKGDLIRSTTASVTAGKTIGFDLVAAADVTTDKATVSGSFPLTGALMTTAAVSDLGHMYFDGENTYPTTIKSDAVNQELWRFVAHATSQNMELRYVKLTMIGTILNTDIKDLKLSVGGVQVGTTQQIAADKTVTFDLTGTPYSIASGQSKVFVLTGTMNGGSAKTFKFTIQRQADLVAYDTGYNVYNSVAVDAETTAFSTLEPTTGVGTTISSGTLTSGVPTDAPSGNVADGATNVSLAKFSFTAAGEDVKISSLDISTVVSDVATKLKNVKLLLDGSQIGTTATTVGNYATTTFSFGNTFVVKPGTPRYVMVVADLNDSTVAADDTIAIALVTSATAQGQTTLNTLSTGSQTGRTLTVKAGTVTVTKNASWADRSATLPTGTKNARAAKIASFIITAGSGEASDVTQIVLKDVSNVSQMGDNFQNLTLKNGTTQIGDVIGTLDTSSSAATYTFNPATAIRINAGEQYVVDVYADILANPQDSSTLLSTNGVIEVDSISATGVSTSSDTGIAAGHDKALQNGYISSNGNLTITKSGDSPAAQQLVMGSTDVEVAKFLLAADQAENINISDIYLAASVSAGATGTLGNLKLYKGTTQVGTVTNTGSLSTSTYAVARFSNLNLVVPANQNIILTVKADISTAGNATTGSTFTIALLPDYDGSTSGNQESIVAKGESSGLAIDGANLDFSATPDAAVTANQMTVYASKLTVAFETDSPTGSIYSSGGDDQVIAKIRVSNATNVDNKTALVKYLNFAISQSGTSKTGNAAVEVKVYKGTQVHDNLVATTSFPAASNVNIGDTGFTNGTNHDTNFIDTEIASGAYVTFLVTMDTNQLEMDTDAGAESISIGMAADDIDWRDGYTNTTAITTSDSLPLTSKTLNYPAR